MATPSDTTAESLIAKIDFTVSGQPIHGEITVPKGCTSPVKMIPIFNALAETIVQIAVQSQEAQGLQISCKKGCGACCRQLVPISAIEAVRIREVIDELPEPRRSQVRARFAEARARLERAGLLDKLRDPQGFPDVELRPLGMEYFQQGIPCPFLEEESCSIHPDRPISCREYLVTSPAEHCVRPTAETVRCVPLAAKVSKAVARMGPQPSGRFIRWRPLILADEWVEKHAEDSSRPGPQLLQDLFERLVEGGQKHASFGQQTDCLVARGAEDTQ